MEAVVSLIGSWPVLIHRAFTEHSLAVRSYLNAQQVPQLFVGSGATAIASQHAKYPWTMGLLPSGTHIMPWRIEDELTRLGANYVQAGLWRPFGRALESSPH